MQLSVACMPSKWDGFRPSMGGATGSYSTATETFTDALPVPRTMVIWRPLTGSEEFTRITKTV